MRRMLGAFSQHIVTHKRLAMSVLVALLIVGGGLFALEKDRDAKKQSAKMEGNLAAVATKQDAVERDSDGDGLPDWEEYIYETDMANPDTDGDGTKDGEEVRIHRDPGVPNTAKEGEKPNDHLTVLDDPDFATSSSDIDGIKREFFAKYLKERGDEIREATFRNIIKKFNPKEFTPRYTLLDLTIVPDTGPEATRTYGNAMARVIGKHSAFQFKRVELVIKEALAKKDSSLLNALDKPIVAYRNLAADLRTIPVPADIAKTHLAIVNGEDGIARALAAMLFLIDDPIRGSGGYESYLTNTIQIKVAHVALINYFHDKGVVFTDDEPASLFFGWPEHASSSPDTANTGELVSPLNL